MILLGALIVALAISFSCLATAIWSWTLADLAGRSPAALREIETMADIDAHWRPNDLLLSERGLRLRKRGNRLAKIALAAFGVAVACAGLARL